MAQKAINYITAEEYLEKERTTVQKHEYYKGEVFLMSGATIEHNRIQRNFIRTVGNFLDGHTCEVFGSDLRVHIPSNSLFTYPDAVIVCGKPELLSEELDTLLNPVLIVEILSKSTQSYDRGDKFMLYRAIPSLREYILIGSENVGVEHFSKQENGTWTLEELKSITDILQLHCINFPLSLSLLYDGVEV